MRRIHVSRKLQATALVSLDQRVSVVSHEH